MIACFADTAYFIGLLSPSDETHAAATEQARHASRQVITTSAVLNELANHFAAPPNRTVVADFIATLKRNSAFSVVHVDEELFDSGLDHYSRRPDKLWSLIDCISFVVMRERQITEALTSDHHFEQAGFMVLLR